MFILLLIHSLTASAAPVPRVDADSCSTDRRTLLNIIWSCLTTIFLCTWVALHPNIPEPVDTRQIPFLKKCSHKISCILRDKVPLFLCALIIPEYILAWAIRQHLMARTIAKENSNLGLTLTHGFFIIMGGFHYFEPSADSHGGKDSQPQDPLLEKSDPPTSRKSECRPAYPLTQEDVISMLEAGKIDLPTEGEIQDRSKSDWIAKTLVLVQTLWFVMQCIARRLQHLPTTELEIVTLAYTAINVGIFTAWLYKPRNVEHPIRVLEKPTTVDDAEVPPDLWHRLARIIVGNQDRWVDPHSRRSVPIFYSGKPGDFETFTADFITLAVGVLFGAIHCVAWSFTFSSHTKAFLWRMSSVAITAVPVLIVVIPLVSAVIADMLDLKSDDDRVALAVTVSLMMLSGLFYVVARFITLVLAFMNLSALPSGAFETVHWTTLIPHL